jgi:hypothetical protein
MIATDALGIQCRAESDAGRPQRKVGGRDVSASVRNQRMGDPEDTLAYRERLAEAPPRGL